jgi:hypothetical protein
MSDKKVTYLSLESSTGHLFEYSKEPKEGFEKHEFEKDNVTKVSFRRYFKHGIFGNLVNVTSKQSDFGTQMSICMEGVDEKFFISFALFTPKNQITDWARTVISYLPGLVEGKPYRFYPYVIENERNGKTYKNYGCSFRFARLSDNAIDDVNLPPQLTAIIVNKDGEVTRDGDIPPIEWEEGVGDKIVANTVKRDKYLWNIFKEHRVGNPDMVSGGSGQKKTFNSQEEGDEVATPAPKKAAKATTEKTSKTVPAAEPLKEEPKVVVGTAEEEDEDDDNLPF